jgi:hypothetical protein
LDKWNNGILEYWEKNKAKARGDVRKDWKYKEIDIEVME